MPLHADIFEGTDQENAATIRSVCKSLGTELLILWTDEQVCQFFNTASGDSPRLWTDAEKADMKHASQILGG